MIRRILAVASLLAAMASAAWAQSYPTYAGAMPQGGMYPQGMYPQGMSPYGPMPGAYPGMMPQGGMNPGLNPQQMAYPDPMGPGGYAAPANYQVPAGPTPKLPRGVTSENGLLYYKGKPYAESSNQYNPYRTVGYDAPMDDGSGQQGMPSVMQGGYGPAPSYQMQGQGGGCNCGDGNCGGGCNCGGSCNCGNGCNCGGACGDGYCDGCWGHGWCTWLLHPFANINPFPGKYGYGWYAGVEALAMNRDAGSNRILVQNTDTLASLFNSNQFSFDFVSGARAHINLMGPSGIQYQAVYMKLATMIANADIIGNNNLQIPFPLAGDTTDFFGANEMLFHYTSAIQSGELNVIYPFGNFQLLGGYRYMAIDESLRLTSIDIADAGTSDFTDDCFNQMHGGQIGLLGQWELFGLVFFDFDAKFGIFTDRVSQHQVLRDFNNTVVLRDTFGHESSVAYVTELGAQIVMPLGAAFSIHCGYDVLFLDRIGLAPDQLDFTDNAASGTQAHQKNDIIVQGVTLGIDAKW